MKKALYLYCVFVVLWFISNRFLQDSWWVLVLLDKFAGYFLFGSIPVFLLSLLIRKKSRKKTAIAAAVIPMLVCAFFYLPFFLNFGITQASTNTEYLRIATFNIWNNNKDIEGVVALINEGESDVIAVQEITEAQRPKLTTLLSATYPYYYISEPVYGGTTALFSRHALYNLTELDFNIDRPAVVADFDWQGQRVSIVSAHLNPSYWAYHQQPWRKIPANFSQYIKDQNTQAKTIVNALEDREGSDAYFLACDCNSQETASTNRLLGAFFKDTFKTLGWQLGAPNDDSLTYEHNLMHIDYVWHAGDTTPIAIYRTKDSAGSDHQQILADYLLK